MTIIEMVTEIKKVTKTLMPVTEMLVQKTNDVEEIMGNLEKRVKKIEREIKIHWRILDIFLFLNIIVWLLYEIFPIIRWLYQLF